MTRPEQSTAGPLREILIGTSRLADDVSVLTTNLGWVIRDRQPFPSSAAREWRAPLSAGAAAVRLEPADGELAGVRLVEIPAVPSYRPFQTPGWAAVELVVDLLDPLVDAVAASGAAQIVGRPAAIGDSGGLLRAAQIVLPGGAPLYLTEINGQLGRFCLPRSDAGRASSPPRAAGAFIAVLAASALEPSRAFLIDHLGGEPMTDHLLAVGVLNRSFDLAASVRHRVSTVQLAGSSAIEVDQLPDGWSARPGAPGHLPPGVAGVEVCGNDDRLAVGPDGALLRVVAVGAR